MDYEKSTNGANIGVYVLNDTVSTISEEIAKDTESAYYVGSYDEKISTTGRNTAGNFKSITFSDKGEYVIAFDQQGKEASTRYSHIYGFTLTAELDSVDTAVTAAQNQFHSVKLLKNAQAQAAADAAAAAAVDAKIAAIGKVTLESKDAIAQARADYENLTDAQKALVSNLKDLEAAADAYAELIKDATNPDTGDSVSVMLLAVMALVSAFALAVTSGCAKRRISK